ncbi:MAG: DUF2383 domain-containing protein [Ferruginibacter sp.]
MEMFNTGLSAKFSGLLFFLKRSKQEFEMVADEIENNPLKTALNGLSDESSYYAGEIKSYLKSLGVNTGVIESVKDEAEEYYYPLTAETGKGDELLSICSHNELTLLQAYNDLLEEPIPFQSLKEIMIYQLNALKYTFLKIKTLNTARFVAY